MAAKSGKGSKAKGGAGEREVVKIFKDAGFEDAARTPFSGANKNFPGDVMGMPGLHLEVKRRESTRFYEWMKQAEADRKPGRMPIVLHRRNNGEWMVFCRLDHFIQLYKKATGRRSAPED